MDNITSNNILTEKQILKREKLLQNLEQEIKGIEDNINNLKRNNAKIEAKRKFKLSLCFARLIAPYLLVASMSFAGAAHMEFTPFVRDEQKNYLSTKKNFNSLGDISYEKQYGAFNVTDKIYYIGEWRKDENDSYSRMIITYDIGKISEEDITRIVNENDISSLEKIFKNPKYTLQTRNNLTKEEIATKPYIEATIFSISKNEFIKIKESVSDDLGMTVVWAMFTILMELVTALIGDNSSFKYKDAIYEINQKYSPINVEVLKRKLEIARNNYDRLTR